MISNRGSTGRGTLSSSIITTTHELIPLPAMQANLLNPELLIKTVVVMRVLFGLTEWHLCFCMLIAYTSDHTQLNPLEHICVSDLQEVVPKCSCYVLGCHWRFGTRSWRGGEGGGVGGAAVPVALRFGASTAHTARRQGQHLFDARACGSTVQHMVAPQASQSLLSKSCWHQQVRACSKS